MTIQLSLEDAMRERDAGIAKAEANADAISPEWREEAFELLKEFIETNPGEFMVEQIRSYAAMKDFVAPASNRIWGSIVLKAVKSGLIKKLRVEPVTNKKAHACFASVWLPIKQSA